jgi:hypothetical protein
LPGSTPDTGLGVGNTFFQNGVAVSIRGAATGNMVINNFISFSQTGVVVRDKALFNSIGTPTAGNTIVGSMEHGILINGKEAEGQKIQGTSIGILPTTSVDPPPAKEGNGGDGVRLEGAPDTLLGGATKGAGNTISRNQGNGITVTGTTGSTWIMGNVIGPDPTGRTTELNGIPTGNGGEGIRLELNMILDCAPTITNRANVLTLGDLNSSNNSDEVMTEVEYPRVTGIEVQGNHASVSGAHLQKRDEIRINDQDPKKTKFKNSTTLLVKKGAKLLIPCDSANPDGADIIELRREIDGNLETIDVLRVPRCRGQR